MAARNIEQAARQLGSSNSIEIVFKADSTGDSLCAALALGTSLKEKQKKVRITGVGGKLSRFSFLPGFSLINQPAAGGGNLLIITARSAAKKLNEFWYEEKDGDVKVFISSQGGHLFKKEDVAADIEGTDRRSELTVTVGVRSPELLGEYYEKNTKKFFESPVINIDNDVSNESYGTVNVIDLVASSLSEMVFNLLEKMENPVDKNAATVLLTGIICRTNSFQNLKTTPRAFFVASKLMDMGADKEEIVRHLYKTRSMGLLKLWGRTLGKLRTYPDVGLVSSAVSYEDIQKAQVSEDDVNIVAEDLAQTLSDARAVLFLAEVQPKELHGYVYSKPSLHVEDLGLELGGEMVNGHSITFKSAGEPEKQEAEFSGKIQNWLKNFEKV